MVTAGKQEKPVSGYMYCK